MKTEWSDDRFGRWVAYVLVALSCIALSGGAASGRESDDDEGDDGGRIPLTVTKAVCGRQAVAETPRDVEARCGVRPSRRFK